MRIEKIACSVLNENFNNSQYSGTTGPSGHTYAQSPGRQPRVEVAVKFYREDSPVAVMCEHYDSKKKQCRVRAEDNPECIFSSWGMF